MEGQNHRTLLFFVNGRKVTVDNPDPEMTLLEYLRYKLLLTGTKAGCAEGGCGACTVMFSRYDSFQDVIYHYAVNACLTPLCSVHGIAVTTVEGLGSVRTKLHPIQTQIAENHGSQCGFCTPGFVMSTYALLRSNPQPCQQELIDAFEGNLCRCTGYRPILEGVYSFSKEFTCPMQEKCCKVGRSVGDSDNVIVLDRISRTLSQDGEVGVMPPPTLQPLYDPSQEPIFPPELKLMSRELIQQNLRFESARCVWLRPTTLEELLDIKKGYPDCKLVTGNTEIGIETKFMKRHYRVMVSPAFVRELRSVDTTEKGLRFGASVTLAKMERFLKKAVDEYPEEKTRVFKAFLEMLGNFAGPQIRNMATLGGNIVNASPISDLNPLLMACNAEIEFAAREHSGFRKVTMDDDFFRGYRKTRLRAYEILAFVTLPFTTENEYIFGYKQASRKEDDIAIANAGMYINLGDGGTHIEDICLAFGGMSVNTVRATKTMKELKGRKWERALLDFACSQEMLPHDLPLMPGAPGGMVAYRRTLCISFFFKFFLAVSKKISETRILPDAMSPQELSGSESIQREASHGCQLYTIQHSKHFSDDTIGKPIIHRAAYKQCTGEAIYLDDVPISQGELFLGLVMSRRAHARLVKVDLSPALGMPGVVDVLDHSDVPGHNQWDPLEQAFAKDKVVHEGQVIAAVVAHTHAEAQRAANCVIVEYEDLEPIISIHDAIRNNSFYPCDLKVDSGDVTAAFADCEHVIEGSMNVSGQEHFYLEPHGCIVYPRDVGEIEALATSQSPTQMQKALIRALGFPANQISVKVKRLGGGFGGKETRNVTVLLPSAVAAVKTNRPVRCILDRNEDMCLTGTRHPAYATYKIGFNKDGKILAIDADLYLNMGHSLDLSYAVLETALLEIDTAYNVKNFRVKGHLCHTNLTSCTAFRGFGGPQAIIVAESWVSHVADFLDMDPELVRERNFYQDGEETPCGQPVLTCNVRRCWDECIKNADFFSRKEIVQHFNKDNRWRKRGICVTPLKYGLAFLLQSMNQGSALIHIYTDGTVLISHGGVEMGQGLHTKLIQVASRELSTPVSYIHISETCTSTVPNTGPTAASMSSDLYGAAVMDACAQLNERLAPYKAMHPDGTLKDWAHQAHQDRVLLSAVGFYKLENVNLDWSRKKNTPFSYFTFGAACTEVEIDCLTGDHVVLRTDIVMDVGKSLNPGIDVGQIEGAFLQGYGLVALEDYKMSPSGAHLSKGPGTYKIPSVRNIPQEMNVALLANSKNPRAIYSSKGVGEPPLCLATSVLLALKGAIAAARVDNGQSRHFRLDTPATPERIRLACLDKVAQMFNEDDVKDRAKPWYVNP